MSKNLENLRNAHTAFSNRGHDKAKLLVANKTNFVDNGKGMTASNQEEFLVWLNSHTAMSSNMKLVDAIYIDQGEWVTAMFRAVGIQDGPMGPFPPSNKEFSLNVCEVWRFNSEGQAIEGYDYSDSMGLAMQLGHIPAP